jgi:hypothetical protein
MYKISLMILDEHFSLGGKREKLRAELFLEENKL